MILAGPPLGVSNVVRWYLSERLRKIALHAAIEGRVFLATPKDEEFARQGRNLHSMLREGIV